MKKNSFIEGTIIATIAIIFVKLLGALYVIPFYKIVGEEGGVLYTYAYNIYNLMLSISITGFPIAMSKLISEYNTKKMEKTKEKTYKISRNIILVISIFSFFIVFCFAEVFGKIILGNITNGTSISDIAFVIRIVSFSLLIVPFLSITRGYLQGHNFMKEPSTSQIIEQIIRIFIVLVGSYLTIKVFNKSITLGVGVALSGAFFGGLAAYIYLKLKIKKHKKEIVIEKPNNTLVETSIIIKKFISYSIPSIIISVAASIYDFTDMVLIIRACTLIGYSSFDAELIASIISNWGVKICMIITAVATAISMNVIPHMTEAFVKKNKKEMNDKFIQAITTTLVISIPMSIGISILSKPVYTVFYGESIYGPLILKVVVFASLIANLNTVINMCFIGLNEYKTIYITNIIGILINLAIDIPLMLLFEKIGLFPVWGASFATIIGYSASFIICYIIIKKKFNFNFKDLSTFIKKLILPVLVMTIPLVIINHFINYDMINGIKNILIILIYAFIGAILYFIVGYLNGLFTIAFREDIISKIINRVRRK